MQSFANVYITPRVRASLQKVVRVDQHKKFWELIAKLKNGRFEIRGLNIEKLHGKASKIYSARMNRELRLIFSVQKEGSENALIIHELNHHDDAYNRAHRTSSGHTGQLLKPNLDQLKSTVAGTYNVDDDFASDTIDAEETVETNSTFSNSTSQLFKVPHYLLVDPGKYIQFERSLDRYLILSEEQEEILANAAQQSLLVQGPAGTGKTTLALFHALNLFEANTKDAVYLFTYNEDLACVCRAYKVNLLGDDDKEDESTAGIKVFSYIDFCKRHLRNEIRKEHKEFGFRWINKEQSIGLLNQVLSQKSRWERSFKAEDIYGLIYSILKGRFMIGTESLPSTREDYERVFRDYGRTPGDLDQILEIFSQYQGRLERNKMRDEADIIRLSYESLKNKARLAELDQRLWIVIDEIQDFTELEWKSILLFWENQTGTAIANSASPSGRVATTLTYPFLSGDVNQNISRSGFRWQEPEGYLQSILRKFHRPNALQKITLHQNYRNTRQIHQLASFVRKFGSDTSDLGLAPDLDGPIPLLNISNDAEMAQLLRAASEKEFSANARLRDSSLSPIVVLVEDEQSLINLRAKLSDCPNIFLLSLRNSKGMEFEDAIIYRAFSSSSSISDHTGAETARLFDLWYMGICRARRSLLLILSAEDRTSLKTLFKDRYTAFLDLIEANDDVSSSLQSYLDNRELITPNYNVIFLERKLAEDLWQTYLSKEASLDRSSSEETDAALDLEQKSVSDNPIIKARDRALNLWKRCLDYASLGRALVHLKKYKDAIPYLLRAGLEDEAAPCLVFCERYLEAAQLYEKIGSYLDAAKAYEYAHYFQKAAETYEKIDEWALAAENYYSAGDLQGAARACEKSGMYRSAADIFKIKQKFSEAAELYDKAEDFLSAAEMHLSANNKLEAARAFQRGGRYDKSIELFEDLGKWSEAGDACVQGGMHAEAAEFFLKDEKFRDSANSFERAAQFEKAAELYLRIKEFSLAANCFERAGKKKEAANAFEQSGEIDRALEIASISGNVIVEARCLEKLNQFQKAADCYIKADALNEAAYCLEKAEDFERAAEMHLKSENYSQAAVCLVKVDRRLDAAKLYISAGQISAAYEIAAATSNRAKLNEFVSNLIKWCQENKRTSAQAQLFELHKDFASAAQKYLDSMNLSKAAACYMKSGKSLEAGKLYAESGEFEKAAECFKAAKKWKEAGQCMERAQKWDEAKQLYERCQDIEGINRCASAMKWL